MKTELHFLSGIPRSGSTVLAAILNQNPKLRVSTTSSLIHVLNGLAEMWPNLPLMNNDNEKLKGLMRSTIDFFYSNNDTNQVIIDKSRGWPISVIMKSMEQVLGRKVKIIATVRSIPECAASLIRIANPKDLDEFIYSGKLLTHLKAAYISLSDGYLASPDNFLIIEYNNLINNPVLELERIHKFLELEGSFDYDFNNIDGSMLEENDEEIHGYAGIHKIGKKLERQHDIDVRKFLGYHYDEFCQPEFWSSAVIEEERRTLIKEQVYVSQRGDFEKGWELVKRLEEEEGGNHFAAYNSGYYYLSRGELQKGYGMMDRGRKVGIFGSPKPVVGSREWDGKSRGIVVLYLEGGLGDEIHQMRYVRDIVDRGCKVIVACEESLASIFSGVEGVSNVISHSVVGGVYHDYFVMGFTVILQLGLEVSDIRGVSYINIPNVIKSNKFVIGLRWQGGSVGEDPHNKNFPYELMFAAVEKFRGAGVEFVSLQRDFGEECCPGWVRRVGLRNWEDTRRVVAGCDLVITACTSISHLAGAMGIETWVIIPILPYFVYAIPGETTIYYDSVRLFRQQVFGDWSHPFDNIKKELEKRLD